MDDTKAPEGQAGQAQSPSHGICLVIGWEGGTEPEIRHLPPGAAWTMAVPEDQRISWYSVSAWEPPVRLEKVLEHGWCTGCQTACAREEGTQTWYNFFGRSDCKALGVEGPHEVRPAGAG